MLAASAAEPSRQAVTRIVAQIQRADYEGDREALNRLNDQLLPFVDDALLASRVRYWRGFALWRRAINGFNDSVDSKEQEKDLTLAVDEFGAATKKDPAFVDAKVGALSCLGFLMFVNQANGERLQQLAAQAGPLRKEIQAVAPDNPRLLWVLGPAVWNAPAERGGGQDKAIASYQRGLAELRKSKSPPSDPLEPSWGEPELLMSLSWSNLNKTAPDLDAAEKDARAALKQVPYWHYVRDILLPQILDAKAKSRVG
jgi:hypothetical protein